MKDLITGQDREFVAGVCRKYEQFDSDALLELVNAVRNDFDYASGIMDSLTPLRLADIDEFKKKLAPGTKILRIVIETNKGPLVIWNYNDIFKNFVVTARRVFSKYKDYSEGDKKLYRHFSYRIPAYRIYKFFNNAETRPWVRRVVIGMFWQYLQLWKDSPIRSEVEWNENPTSYQDWPHYLARYVEDHEEKIQEDFIVGKKQAAENE